MSQGPEESAFPGENEGDRQTRTDTLAKGADVAGCLEKQPAPLAPLVLTTLGHPPAHPPLLSSGSLGPLVRLQFTSYLLFPWQAPEHKGSHRLYHPVGDHRSPPARLPMPTYMALASPRGLTRLLLLDSFSVECSPSLWTARPSLTSTSPRPMELQKGVFTGRWPVVQWEV